MDFLPSLTSLREMIPQKQVFEAFLKLLDEFNQTHETDRIQSFRRSRCLWKMRCLLRDNSMKPVWIEMRKQGVFGLKDKMLDCEIRIFERLDGLDERYIRAIPVRAQKLIADRAFNADWLPRIRSLIDSGRDLSATVYREEFLRDTDNSLEIDDDPGCCWINDYLEDMRRQLQPNSKPPHTVNLRCGEIANSDPHDNLSDSVEATYVDPPTPSRGRGQKATVKSIEPIAVPEPAAAEGQKPELLNGRITKEQQDRIGASIDRATNHLQSALKVLTTTWKELGRKQGWEFEPWGKAVFDGGNLLCEGLQMWAKETGAKCFMARMLPPDTEEVSHGHVRTPNRS